MSRSRYSLVATAVLALLLASCSPAPEAPRVVAGGLDLSSWDFIRDGSVTLEGEWEICWGELVAPGEPACPGGDWTPFPVPRLWSDSGVAGPVRPRGIATYRARIALPSGVGPLALRVGSPMTAHRLFINGEARGGTGRVGRRPEDTTPELVNRVHTLPAGLGQLDLLVHVANFDFRGGGLRRRWSIGDADQIAARNAYELLLYASFATMSLVIGLVFLAQFAFRRSESARGWFGAFAVLVALRIVPGSSSDLYQLVGGWASFEFLMRLEYANVALLIFVGAAYLRAKIPDVMPPAATQGLQFAALALVPIHALAPFDLVLATISILLVLPVLLVVLALASYGRAWSRGRSGALATFMAAVAFAVGIFHDVVRTQTGLGAAIELFPYAVVVWMLVEAQDLLKSFARTFARVEQLSLELRESNFELQEDEHAVVRFVPFDLLRTLGKESVRDVAPGDHAAVEMTVLDCDLEVVEQETSARTFALLNELLLAADALIEARGGFASHQLGDRIVVLFPGSAAAAVAAADEIQAAARNLSRSTSEPAVRVGIGVATGTVLLGTVGDAESLSGVALGNAVSLARRLGERALRSGAGTLLSRSTRDALGPAPAPDLRESEPIELPGMGSSEVFEVLRPAGAAE